MGVEEAQTHPQLHTLDGEQRGRSVEVEEDGEVMAVSLGEEEEV